MKRNILVCGATGRQGGAVAYTLLAEGFGVLALTRQPNGIIAKRLEQAGAVIVEGNLNNHDSISTALNGVDGVFAMQTPYEEGVDQEISQGIALAEIARSKGVKQFVYSSVLNADLSTGVPHYESKGIIERQIAKLNFPYTSVIRPALFMEMFLMPAFLRYVASGHIELLIPPDKPLPMICVRDIARAAALAFCNPADFDGAILNLSGDQPTMVDIAAAISEAANKQVSYAQVSKKNLPPDVVPRTRTQEWFTNVGWKITPTIYDSRHHLKWQSFKSWAQEHSSLFQMQEERV